MRGGSFLDRFFLGDVVVILSSSGAEEEVFLRFPISLRMDLFFGTFLGACFLNSFDSAKTLSAFSRA